MIEVHVYENFENTIYISGLMGNFKHPSYLLYPYYRFFPSLLN